MGLEPTPPSEQRILS